MSLAILIAMWFVAVATASLFSLDWLPIAASPNAGAIDRQLRVSLIVLGVVFLATHIALGYFVYRFRYHLQSDESESAAENLRFELAWLAAAAILFISLNVYGNRHLLQPSAAAQPATIEVTAAQFQWYFRTPGPDGRFGRSRPELQDAELGNPLGLDRNDPAVRDDFVSTSLTLPAGQRTVLELRSLDVVHSFFVPQLRIKQDAVPGLLIPVVIDAPEAGEYEIVCAELCGLGHHEMNARLHVTLEGGKPQLTLRAKP